MYKRIKFIISLMLIFAIFVGCFCLPAASYENNVKTSSADIVLVNMDTDTTVYSQKPDNKWYAGYLSELVTFLICYEDLPYPDAIEYKVEQSFISDLTYSDGCLDAYVDQTLTVTDLMAIMLLTSGSDAANALADLASGGDRAAFVEKMNDRVKRLGCEKTHFASPGYDETTSHVTTCRDLYVIYSEVYKNEFYQKLMDKNSYVPTPYKEEADKEENTIISEASIMNSNSPYYFRYVNDAKYSHTESTYSGIALTTTYRGKTYFFAALLGQDGKEKNVYADAKSLTTWAYLNLSDRKVLSSEDAISQVKVVRDWGEYDVDLHPFNSAFKTLPNDYEEEKLTYTFDVPESVGTPLFKGQGVGEAKLYYEGDEIDTVKLIVNSDEGLGMLSDTGRFYTYIYSQLTVNQPPEKDDEDILADSGKNNNNADNDVTIGLEKPVTAETEG